MYERAIISVGSIMPDFTVRDESGRALSLSVLRRDLKYVVLAFVRGADDAHTRRQLAYLKDDYLRFRHYGGDVVAVSCGDAGFNDCLRDELRLPFRLLSDPDCVVIRKLGIYNAYDKLAGPVIYLLNKAGTVLFLYMGREPSDIAEDEEILMAMQGDTQTGPEWPQRW
jgi:peroxiredoxin